MSASGDHRQDAASGTIFPEIFSAEGAAQNTFLDPRLTLLQFSIRSQTGQLGAGPRSAGRSIVGLAGAQHKVARVAAGCGRTKEFYVVDLGKPLSIDRLANPPTHIGQGFNVLKGQLPHRGMNQKKPIPTPGHVARNRTDPRHLHNDRGLVAVGRHIGHRNRTVGLQGGGDRADRGVNSMGARSHSTQVRQGDH